MIRKYTIKQIQEKIVEMMRLTIEICERNNITYYCQAGTVLGAIRHKGMIPWDADADLIIPSNEVDRFAECASRELPEGYYVNYYKLGNNTHGLFPRIGIKGYATKFIHLDIFILMGIPDDRALQEEMQCEAESYRKGNSITHTPLFFHLKSKHIKNALLHPYYKLTKGNYYADKMDELIHRYEYDKAEYVMNPFGKYKLKNVFKKEVYGEGSIVPFENLNVRIPSEYDFYLKQYYKDYMKFPDQEYVDHMMSKDFIFWEKKH